MKVFTRASRLCVYCTSIAVCGIAVVLSVSLVRLGSIQSQQNNGVVTAVPDVAPYMVHTNPDLFYRGITAVEDSAVAEHSTPAPKGLILPHHDLASDLIATGVASLRQSGVKHIILIGPNHKEAGAAAMIAGDQSWSTQAGTVTPSTEILNGLVQGAPVSLDRDVIAAEHSITAILPYIAQYLSDVSVTPIIVKRHVPPAELEQLTALLAEYVKRDDVVLISSVDFSHYLPVDVAYERDTETVELLRTRNTERLLQLDEAHLDSPATVAVLLEVLSRVDAHEMRIVAHKNSSEYIIGDDQSTTSYFVAEFYNAGTRPSSTELLFVGDIMLSRLVGDVTARSGDWAWPFRLLDEQTTSTDIFFANLENPISDRGANVGSIYSFRADPRVVEGLTVAGIDIVSLANNHIGDWGLAALEDTMTILTDNDIAYAGTGWNLTDAHMPTIIEKNGTTFAFLAYTPLLSRYVRATEDRAGATIFDQEVILSDITTATAAADVVIVSYHFGEEYETEENQAQRSLAEASIDAGASLVIGHHPHVVQPVALYKDGYIAYSLGNFIFDQTFSKATMEGLALRVLFDGEQIQSVEEIPTSITPALQAEILFSQGKPVTVSE